MASPLGVGLHIIYGRMGAGKTNFAINELLVHTTYKKCVLNVPLYQEFEDTLPQIEFTKFKKLEPDKVIRLIDGDHQDTLFIVDESQMVLMSANKLLVDSFCKKMSQIRQNNQCVIVIAQISKMLPNTIKDLAESCYFFENNNIRGIEKSSKVKHYRTGYDYTTRLIETFTYVHKYGTYESTNTPTTEKPKNLYKRTYIKIAIIFGIAFLLFVFGGYQIYKFICRFTDDETNQEQINLEQTNQEQTNYEQTKIQVVNDSLCIRSFIYIDKGIYKVVYSSGELDLVPLSVFSQTKKCHL